VLDKPEDDLANFRDARMTRNACSWVESKPYFTHWRDGFESPQFLWLRARPGFGKSVLAGYIVDHLMGLGCDCSYFFFIHRHPSKSKLSGSLRSLAYQMALAPRNNEIRECLLALQQADFQFDHDDEQAIWRKIFVAGILRTDFETPQYWIIDGIDECDHPTSIFPLLARLENIPWLRVIITSRDSSEITKTSTQLKTRMSCEEISVQDTMKDIQNYTEEQVAQLKLEDDFTCNYVTTTVLAKSLGCFLWVKLVLKELSDVHLRSSIEQILEDVPEGMDPLYARTLDRMSKQVHGNSKGLVQAILTWTMCATRPLTFPELQSALEVDIGEDVYRLRQAVNSMCSQLVFIDANDHVQPVHETAREYLLGDTKSEWATSRAKGNSRLVEICLKYLTGQEMAIPRNRRTTSSHNAKQQKSPFAIYACAAFSEHLRTATASSDQLLMLLAKFLQTNVLSWIDLVARDFKSVHHLTVAAKNLKLFLDRRTKYKSPLGIEFSTTDAWSVDLDRVATKFGRSLLSSPSAIYWLVPALCPLQSAIRKQFGRDARGIEVLGMDSSTWDDRLSCIIHRNKTPSSVACGDSLFAVGFSDPPGLIWLYGISTCQEKRSMTHPESVKALEFSSVGDLLASSGSLYLHIWNAADGNCLFTFQTRHEPLSLAFTNVDTVLLAASKGNHTCSWDLQHDGTELEICSWYDSDGSVISQNVPSVVVFNHERTLLAAVYMGYPISLWETEDSSFLGYVHRDPSQLGDLSSPRGVRRTAAHPHVEDMVFNPKTDQLVASYADGELCCFDPWSQELEFKENVYVQTLACSPDGRTLAGGDSHGTIQIREFRTLRLLYKIVAFDDPIRSLTFTSNSLRLLDIRGSTCNVWEPSVLVRSEQNDDESVSDAIGRNPVIVESEDAEDIVFLTAMVPGTGSSVFVGREDGNVALYDTATGAGKQGQVLYPHAAGAAVSAFSWSEAAATLASADLASNVIVTKIASARPGSKVSCTKLLDVRLDNQAIRAVLLNRAGDRLLVSSSICVYLYSLTGEVIKSRTYDNSMVQVWLRDPSDSARLIGLSPSGLRIFDWETFHESHHITFINRATTDVFGPKPVIKRMAVVPKSTKVLLRVVTSRPKSQITSLRILDVTQLSAALSTVPRETGCGTSVQMDINSAIRRQGLPQNFTDAEEETFGFIPPQYLREDLEPLTEHLEQIIGTIPNSSEVVFLNRILWVCTVDIEKFSTDPSYTRHFFIPHEWITNNEEMIIQVTAEKDILLLKRDKLIIFKRGLRNGEKVAIDLD